MAEQDRLIAQIMDAQRRLHYLFMQDRSNPIFDSHLTMSQLKILLMLAAGGGASGQELQRFMGVSLATVTGIVDRLVIQDLVERREDPADRRVRRIELTPHGTEIIEGIITAGMERQQQLLQRLSVPELEIIERGIHILAKAACGQNHLLDKG